MRERVAEEHGSLESHREPFASWLEEIARELSRGELDGELAYTKAGEGGARLAYVMTIQGLEPTADQRSPIDHGHYLTKQLAPACDVVLSLLGTSFEKIAGTQGSLF